jgi:hypothetical protein
MEAAAVDICSSSRLIKELRFRDLPTLTGGVCRNRVLSAIEIVHSFGRLMPILNNRSASRRYLEDEDTLHAKPGTIDWNHMSFDGRCHREYDKTRRRTRVEAFSSA